MTGDVWRRPGLSEAIFEALRATGKDMTALTIDDLAPFDQFHGGGLGTTRALARLLNPAHGSRVLDVGGGLGGPARTLAVEHGCDVTVIDITEDYVEAGEMLTRILGLGERVRFQVGDALALPFPDASFDVVWTQNSGMNIADKAAMYSEFHRMLRPGGRLAFQEPVAGPGGEPHFPLMWAEHPGENFLLHEPNLRALIAEAGFHELRWAKYNPSSPPPRRADAPAPVTLQSLVKGDAWMAAAQARAARDRQEARLGLVQAMFRRR